MSAPARILVVAGHDPTGGAGVDADREAAALQNVAADCIVTAWTRQDGRRVQALGARDPARWYAEALAALARARPAALKTGLLPGAEHVRAAARLVAAAGVPTVVDPVLAASGGETFLEPDGIVALLEELLPRGVVVTPNVPEAARLSDLPGDELARRPEARVEAARRLLERGAAAVLLKGGHGGEDPVRDLVLVAGAGPSWHEHPRVVGASLHGSGCRYAASVAAALARGLDLERAAAEAGSRLFALLVDSRGRA